MPFKSEAQRRYLYANEPEVAEDWTRKYGSRIATFADGGEIDYSAYASGDFGGLGQGTAQPETVGQYLDNIGTITPPAFEGGAGIATGRTETPTSYEPNYANAVTYPEPTAQDNGVWDSAWANAIAAISATNPQALAAGYTPEQEYAFEQGANNAQAGVQATYPGPTLRDLALQNQDVGRTEMTPFSDAYRSVRDPINEVYKQYVRDPLEDVVSGGLDLARWSNPAFDVGIRGFNEAASRLPVVPEITNRGVANLVVPQNIEQAALELAPGIGTVPGVSSALRSGAREAAPMLPRVGARLVQNAASEGGEALVRQGDPLTRGGLRLAGASDEGSDILAHAAAAPGATQAVPQIGAAAPPPIQLPPRGRTGIDAALGTKENVTLQPGKVFGAEGSVQRKVVGAINPSVDMPRTVHVRNQARTAVQASEYTGYRRGYVGVGDAAERLVRETPPTYIGPADNPFKGLAGDYFQNPRFYDNVSPELQRAKDAWEQAGLRNISDARARYDVDIDYFKPKGDPNGVYVPNLRAKDGEQVAVTRVADSLTSKTGIAKQRAYDSWYDHWVADNSFTPVTDLREVADLHARSLAYMASNNTFKSGIGKTKLEVLEELHPGLKQRKDSLANSISNMRKVAENAGRRGAGEAKQARIANSRLDILTERADALSARIDNLGEDYGPELSFLSGELRQLTQQIQGLNLTALDAGSLAVGSGMKQATIRNQVQRAMTELDDLRTFVNTADIGDYVMSPDTFRYHLPDEAKAIHSVLKKGTLDNAFIDAVLNGTDVMRVGALGPDFSPLTIQGSLGAFSHPEVLIRDAAGLVKAAFQSPKSFDAALDPELVRRFEFASNRNIGSLGEEFSLGTRGPRLPGQPIKKFNAALQRVVDYGTIKGFDNDSRLLMRLGGTTQEVADAESAHTMSQIIPRLNMAETGRSAQRGKLERFAVTSASYTAQPFALAKDYTSAVGKIISGRPGELLGREKLALIRGSSLAGSIMTVAAASALASADANNLSPSEALKEVLDPNSPRFMSAILGNAGSVGLGGPFRRALLGVYRTATQGPEGAYKYVRGGANVPLGNLWDVVVNRDWRGRPIREGSAWHQIQDAVTHIAAQSNLLVSGALEGAEQQGNTLQNAALGFVQSLSGQNFFERTVFDQTDQTIRGEIEKGTLPKTYKDENGNDQPIRNYNDLKGLPGAQEDFDKRHPDLVKARLREQRETSQESAQMTTDLLDRQQERDDTLLKTNPAQWRGESSEDNRDTGIRIDQLWNDAGDFDRDETTLLDVAQRKYHEAIEAATEGTKVDWDAVDRAVATMSQAERDLLFESRLKGETDARKQYIKDLEVLTPFFDQRDLGWQAIVESTPSLAEYKSFDAYRDEQVAEVKEAADVTWAEARALVDKKLKYYEEVMSRYSDKYLVENADALLPLLDRYDFYIPAEYRKYVR